MFNGIIFNKGTVKKILKRPKGINIFIDPSAVMFLVGSEMDYKVDKFSSSFVFNNPNETARCGCGESFSV